MMVRVLYFAQLRDATGCAEHALELPPQATVADAIAGAEQRHPALAPHRRSLLLARNQEWTTAAAELHDGDELALMPPVSGG